MFSGIFFFNQSITQTEEKVNIGSYKNVLERKKLKSRNYGVPEFFLVIYSKTYVLNNTYRTYVWIINILYHYLDVWYWTPWSQECWINSQIFQDTSFKVLSSGNIEIRINFNLVFRYEIIDLICVCRCRKFKPVICIEQKLSVFMFSNTNLKCNSMLYKIWYKSKKSSPFHWLYHVFMLYPLFLPSLFCVSVILSRY